MRILKHLEQGSDYLKDESQMIGQADLLYFTHSTNDVEEVLKNAYQSNTPLTIQGALTGVCGGAVPLHGNVLNLSEMNKVLDIAYDEINNHFTINVQAGLTLHELNQILKSKRFDTRSFTPLQLESYQQFQQHSELFFPNDPTETLASIGGMVSCDASGACSYKYGSIRNYVKGVTLVTPKKTLQIRRGMYKYEDILELFDTEENLPLLESTNLAIKDVAGLYYQDNMDLLDLIIGSEGILGVITEVELILLEMPIIKTGVMLFFNDTNKLVECIDFLRSNLNLAAIEYIDKSGLELLHYYRDTNSSLKKLKPLNSSYQAALYLEFHLDDETEFDQEIIKLYSSLSKYLLDEKEQWIATDPTDYDKLRLFRHALPECINLSIQQKKRTYPLIHKISTDMSVPNEFLGDILKMYYNDLYELGLNGIVFGHIGDNHLHVNIIPNDMNEYQKGKNLIKQWGNVVSEYNGSVSAEHGIGKLKKDLLLIMFSPEQISKMKKLKKLFEQKNLVNKGNMFD